MEFQKEPYCTLRTVQARKAFCYQYKDRLYKLALNETHDPKHAGNLVVAAFQQAFHRYLNKPFPEDCFPLLSASIYLLLATEGDGYDPCTTQSGFQVRATLSGEVKSPMSGTRSYESEQNASTAGHPAEAPRYARASRTDSSQPISQQVYDPEHTEYWMPGTGQGRPSANGAESRSDRSVSYVQASAAISEVESAPAQDVSSPNVSQAYMYNSDIAKKRKSPLLSLLNLFLSLLFLWMLVGLLGRMEILPEWNLGYAWYNLNIYPLF